MANEAVLMVETHLPIQFTVADGTGIEKGAILKMTDPMTAALSDGDGDVIAGIAAEEKIASDGNTTLAVYRGGIFKVLAGAGITVGAALDTHSATGAANEVAPAPVNGENILGIALETASDTHTLLMELRPTVMNLA
tara:strand:- start:433 stop:843 length:411 start_codon:yes stop_codon:yes gene_type:complete